jgi:type II pantothenate kinase
VIVVADLGGSNTDLLLADDAGLVLRSALLPALAPSSTPAFLEDLLRPLDVSPGDVRTIAVTGGRHRRLGEDLAGVPVHPVDEIEAIGRGGLVTSGCERALIVSMGTGTAFVSADGERVTHAAGVALGGGTLRGLSWRLLRTVDAGAIEALAEMGNPRGADLTIADIVGGDVGMLPGDMPAAYFARLAGENPSPADIAAGILDMIGHIAAHMALLTARIHGHDTIVMIGHMLDFATVRRAAARFGNALGGAFIVPPEPGLAVARGALAVVTQPRE